LASIADLPERIRLVIDLARMRDVQVDVTDDAVRIGPVDVSRGTTTALYDAILRAEMTSLGDGRWEWLR